MPFTSLPMRQSSKVWGAMWATSTIHLLQVSTAQLTFRFGVAKNLLATSGACATIASDALMNPFDGKGSDIMDASVT